MSSRTEKSKNVLRDRHQMILSEMLKEDANRLCADCCAKGPRWASWNIGVFVCIRCAGIHRNLGVHISKVKSVNLDSWTPAQIDRIVQWGNQRCKEVYECYLPKDFVRPQGDSAMETFIRSKYERKLYIIKGDISTACLSANPRTSQQKQEEKPQTPVANKVVLQESKTTLKSKPSRLVTPAALPVKAVAASNTTSSSVDDLLSMGDFQGVTNNVPSSSAHSSNVDLFGLDSCPDTFQSQPSTQQIGQSSNVNKQDPFNLNGSTATEQDLFPDDNTVKPAQSAKDSIMSLYATSSTSQQSSNAMYGVPGGVYMANNTQNSNQGGAYTNYQQYQAQPQFHGNSHYHSTSQRQTMPQQQQQQQQPLHHHMQQMSMNNNQMPYNSNQQYASNVPMPTGQYQQQHPASMSTPMYPNNMNNGIGNQRMMPSNWPMHSNQQQPIAVNGNTRGMTAMNPNTHSSMGHTLSTQLWN